MSDIISDWHDKLDSRKVFGQLTYIGMANREVKTYVSKKRTIITALFQCSCGETITRSASEVYSGRTIRCPKCKNKPFLSDAELYMHRAYGRYTERAKIKNIIFDIPYDILVKLINMPCYCCKKKRERVVKLGKRYIKVNFSGLDRIETNGPYSLNNVLPCCWPCNLLRGSLPMDKFLQLLNDITAAGTIVGDVAGLIKEMTHRISVLLMEGPTVESQTVLKTAIPDKGMVEAASTPSAQ